MMIMFIARELVFGMGNKKGLLDRGWKKLFLLTWVVVTGLFALNKSRNHALMLSHFSYL